MNSVNLFRADLLVAYPELPYVVLADRWEVILMIVRSTVEDEEEWLRPKARRMASRVQRKLPRITTSYVRHQISGVCSWIGLKPSMVPALLIKTAVKCQIAK
jgi:hypothetical protein